jgi:uroporphyrinogen decarboxylase
MTKPLLSVLHGNVPKTMPLWMMRQAGRYLPEYRELRASCNGFMDLCFNPKKAAEVTLQPIRRFGFDGAILFSDILVIPAALGQSVTFEEGEGPRLTPLFDETLMERLEKRAEFSMLTSIYETITRVKPELPSHTTMLGFCGAPFTVASYMCAGRGGDEQIAVRKLAYTNPALLERLIELLVQTSVDYLVGQFEAGVEAVQIFDSWAGILPPDEFQKWCIAPVTKMIMLLRKRVPNAPVIYFPRGVTTNVETGANCVSLDWRAGKTDLPITQGNLDPLVLLTGGKALEVSIDKIKRDYAGKPHIFNLGHGIIKETPIAHVEQLIKRVRHVD